MFCPDAVAANAAALRTGRPTMADDLWSTKCRNCLLKKYKFAHCFEQCACSAKIVKRRLIWRLPGIGFYPMSEAGSNDVVDGLAGRIRKRDRNR